MTTSQYWCYSNTFPVVDRDAFIAFCNHYELDILEENGLLGFSHDGTGLPDLAMTADEMVFLRQLSSHLVDDSVAVVIDASLVPTEDYTSSWQITYAVNNRGEVRIINPYDIFDQASDLGAHATSLQDMTAPIDTRPLPPVSLPLPPLYRDYLLEYIGEQNDRLLSLLADLDQQMQETKHIIHPIARFRAYHPAFGEEWRKMASLYCAVAAQMDVWQRLLARFPQDAYERMRQEALAEARVRNQGLKVGDNVVLLKNYYWNKADAEASFSRGQRMTIVALGNPDDENATLEEMEAVALVKETVSGQPVEVEAEDYELLASLQNVTRLSVWDGQEADRLSILLPQLPFIFQVVEIPPSAVPFPLRLASGWPDVQHVWWYQLNLHDQVLWGYEFGNAQAVAPTILSLLTGLFLGKDERLKSFLGDTLYARLMEAEWDA